MPTVPSYLSDYADLYRNDPHAAALAWFGDAKFGLFMHYGIYSLLGRHEWAQFREAIPLAEYEKLKDQFTAENFEQKLQEMMDTYDHWAGQMKDYPHTAERMCEQYYNLFVELLDHRDEILEWRRLQRRPIALLWALLPERVTRKLPWLDKLSGLQS